MLNTQPQPQNNNGGGLINLNNFRPNPQQVFINKAKQMIEYYLNNERKLDLLCQNKPKLAEMIVTNNTEAIAAMLFEEKQNKLKIQRERNQEMMRLQANPFDPEAQKKIEEMINQERLDKIQQETMEYHPELFVSTEMLYIEASVNHTQVQVFVDTGAQTTVISKDFAERAGLMKNVDKRFASEVKGVGQQMSLGRIWNFNVEINGKFFPISAIVLPVFGHEVLLGLDAMKRHNMNLDLKNMALNIPSQEMVCPFLKDHEIIHIPLGLFSIKMSKVMETCGVDPKKARELLKKFKYEENSAINHYLQYMQ